MNQPQTLVLRDADGNIAMSLVIAETLTVDQTMSTISISEKVDHNILRQIEELGGDF